MQEIEIFLNYIGRVELPAQELSGEEMAEEEKNGNAASTEGNTVYDFSL